MIYNVGVMDKDYMWDIEGIIRDFFNFKKDDGLYTFISKQGFDQHYLTNREILKKANIDSLIEHFRKNHRDLCTYYPNVAEISENWDFDVDLDDMVNSLNKHYSDGNKEDLRRVYVVIGFLFLQYQLDIPSDLKDKIINSADCEIQYSYEKDNPVYSQSLSNVNQFKNAILKSNGNGVKNVGVTLPERSLF